MFEEMGVWCDGEFSLPRSIMKATSVEKKKFNLSVFQKESTKNENESASVIDEKKLFPRFHNLDIQASE